MKIRLASLLADQPDTRVHGSELVPYSEEEANRLGNEYAGQRHRDLTIEELVKLQRRSAANLWKNMDKEFKGYAANVPHAAVITPSGKIDPKYLQILTKEASIAAIGRMLPKMFGKTPRSQTLARGLPKGYEGMKGFPVYGPSVYPGPTLSRRKISPGKYENKMTSPSHQALQNYPRYK